MFVDQTKSFNYVMGTHHQQIPPTPAGVVRGSFSVTSDSGLQRMVSRSPSAQVPPTRRTSRGGRSVTSSPYHPNRTFSLPPNEAEIRTCQWMGDDGAACGALIPGTVASVSQHLTTHGVKDMAHDYALSCRWLGCRLRGAKITMRRESIVRHVREKHFGCKRSLQQV